MNAKETHIAISRHFHLSNKSLANLPHCASQRFNRNDLAKFLGKHSFNKGAEIGVRRGRFSAILCKTNLNIELFCIDPWSAIDNKYPQERQDQIYEYAVNVLAPYNAKIVRRASLDVVKYFEDNSFDFIYIDGNHRFDYVCPDIIYWSQKVRSGGIVAVHDFYGGEPGVQKAVEAYVHAHYISHWYMTKELAPTAFWVKP